MATRDRNVSGYGVEREQVLHRTWSAPPGIRGWFMAVNHKVYGRRFAITAFVFFLLAGATGVLLRTQLAVPDNDLIGPDLYNQLFTMHGITMMFLFAVPMGEAIGMYLVPLMIGSRDMAFPRLGALGYWIFLIGGVFLWGTLFFDMAPDTGWFNEAPLSELEFSPSRRVDFYSTIISFIELSALAAAVELVVTILKLRAPGMSLNRMPIFVWSILVTASMIVFAMPAVVVASVMLALDRSAGMLFFDPSGGGDPLLWYHLFWFFGHPEVYIILIPGLGIISTIIPVFSRRPLFGYTAVVLSLVATGIASFGLWVHHMYTMGIPDLGSSFFAAASAMIAIPTGVQIFCWIATLWGGRPILRTPLLFVLGFFFIFVLGGISGVMVSAVSFDQQVHDTYFLVAHFHYVLIGGFVFPFFAGIYYWYPKLTGRMLSEQMGKWNFWMMFMGMNLTFLPMHIAGFLGMPRRVYTYPSGMGWETVNLVETVGAYIFALGGVLFVINAIWSYFDGVEAGENPWGADTLEWATPSPPPPYNFLHLPIVEGRYALWDRKDPEVIPAISGLHDERREGVATGILDAEVQAAYIFPGPTIGPLLTGLAVSVGFAGAAFTLWAVPVSFVLTFLSLVYWFWPRKPHQVSN